MATTIQMVVNAHELAVLKRAVRAEWVEVASTEPNDGGDPLGRIERLKYLERLMEKIDAVIADLYRGREGALGASDPPF